MVRLSVSVVNYGGGGGGGCTGARGGAVACGA